MLAKRIIPCLDVKDGRVVKGVNFLELRDAGDPVEQAQVYDREGADELVFLDITASHERRDIVIDMVRRVADTVFIPFTVGGGIRSADDMRALLLAGADKVSINSPAVRTPELITAGATRFGSQCVVVAIDGKWMGDRWEVFINGGRVPTGLGGRGLGAGGRAAGRGRDPADQHGHRRHAARLRHRHAQRGDRRRSRSRSSPPAGAGKLEHFYDALTAGGADAALAASLFHYRELSVGQVKAYLAERGVPVRLTEE